MFYFYLYFFSADDLVFSLSDTIGGFVPVSKGGGCLDGSGNENAVEFIFVAESLLVVGQQHCELPNDGSATAATAATAEETTATTAETTATATTTATTTTATTTTAATASLSLNGVVHVAGDSVVAAEKVGSIQDQADAAACESIQVQKSAASVKAKRKKENAT